MTTLAEVVQNCKAILYEIARRWEMLDNEGQKNYLLAERRCEELTKKLKSLSYMPMIEDYDDCLDLLVECIIDCEELETATLPVSLKNEER